MILFQSLIGHRYWNGQRLRLNFYLFNYQEKLKAH